MSDLGDYETDELTVQSRTALLDALEALADHRDSIVLIGAHAIYLHTESLHVALAAATKDSDLAIDARQLRDAPLIQAAMSSAGFELDPEKNQPGAWINAQGIPVDLMVPELLAGPGSKNQRGARLPPHDKKSMRRARGLEASVVDYQMMKVRSLDPADTRTLEVRVAGRAALLIAKLHKLGERADDPDRLVDKDAHDVYRLLADTQTSTMAAYLISLMAHDLCGEVTVAALQYLEDLFAAGHEATGSNMAGRAESAVGEPETVSRSVAILAKDLLEELRKRTEK
jgi:hypothetical protein